MTARRKSRPPGFPLQTYADLMLGVATMALAGCALTKGVATQPEPAREGRQTYLRACASCHGESGRGDGSVSAALNTPVPDLTTLAARHGGVFPRDYVLGVIVGDGNLRAHGTREMPVWGDRFDPAPGVAVAIVYTRQRVELLASYLESMQRRD